MTDKTYLYNYDWLFPVEGEMEECEPLVLRCINIEPAGNNNFMGSSTWRFQIQGRTDGRWYQTHYAWSLVEETEDNLQVVKSFHEAHRQRGVLQQQANELFRKFVTVQHNPELKQGE